MGNLAPVWSKVTDINVVSGSGSRVLDASGASYLDFTSGIAVTSTGHSHPRVVAAIQAQAARIMHAQVNCYTHDLLQPLADALDDVTPPGIDTFFFTNSGAEATEAAVKLAKRATARPNVIVFDGSFHGRTHLTMAMTSSKHIYRAGFQPLPSGVFVAPFATEQDEAVSAITSLERILETQTAPNETAAVVIELVQGEGGYRAASHRFVSMLQDLCRAHGILLIIDEVQSGFGRTGRMFAYEHYNVSPDVLILAKGIASGFPFAALGASASLFSHLTPGSHGGTYGGNPMGCAAALATLEVLSEERLVENAYHRGAQLRSGLRRVLSGHNLPSSVRLTGLGMMVGLVCPSAEFATNLRLQALSRGLILMSAGGGQVIRFMPPLVVTREEVEEALGIMEQSLGHVLYNVSRR